MMDFHERYKEKRRRNRVFKRKARDKWVELRLHRTARPAILDDKHESSSELLSKINKGMYEDDE